MTQAIPQTASVQWTKEWLGIRLESLLISKLKSIKYGSLEIHSRGEVYSCGTKNDDQPSATLYVHRVSVWERVAFGGTLGAAESFIDGGWTTDNLVAVVRILVGNRDTMENLEGGLAWLKWPLLKLWNFYRKDTIAQARRNIAAHYDLGNEFFEAWLDPSMTYSSGIFSSEKSTMLGASLRKVYTLCQKLQLSESTHLLEVGSGWGAMAIFAAANYGCKVTTATISEKQFEWVSKEIKRLRLDHLITPVFCDYRNLTGEYDRIVSVEMIEAVGHHFLDTYFATLARLAKPDGLVAIQAITIRDQYYESAIRNVDFIQRYIFPGSNIPSMSRIMSSVARKSDFILVSQYDFTEHYCKTLSKWRGSFKKAHPRLRTLGMNEDGLRMWDYYFSYCEGGFAERAIGVCQFLLAKPQFRGEIPYIAKEC